MGEKEASQQKRRPSAKDIWRLILLIIGVVAVVQELRKPADQRTWHGKVAGLVPYDFRKPTMERFRKTYWNPGGPVVANKAWGVGWAFNFGAAQKMFERQRAA